jgi:hypothetical protein
MSEHNRWSRYSPDLRKLLGVQVPIEDAILQGEEVWDSISRCRLLVQALNIPPPLLGIDGKYSPIEEYPYWWHAFGFAFNADEKGYPVISEVVAHLRMQRTITEEGGSVRTWSQEDLGIATGLGTDAIRCIEDGTNPQMVDSVSIRLTLVLALGNLAGESEPTLFRLFGLDPQAYGVCGDAGSGPIL